MLYRDGVFAEPNRTEPRSRFGSVRHANAILGKISVRPFWRRENLGSVRFGQNHSRCKNGVRMVVGVPPHILHLLNHSGGRSRLKGPSVGAGYTALYQARRRPPHLKPHPPHRLVANLGNLGSVRFGRAFCVLGKTRFGHFGAEKISANLGSAILVPSHSRFGSVRPKSISVQA